MTLVQWIVAQGKHLDLEAGFPGHDLSGAVVRFRLDSVGSADGVVIGEARVLDVGRGCVGFELSTGDIAPGTYVAEFVATYSDGRPELRTLSIVKVRGAS